MPPRKTHAKRGRPRKPRFALMSAPRRRMLYNPQPVFTETFKSTTIQSGLGFSLVCSMANVPQISQYSNLYQKYRILKAQWILLPSYSGGTDENVAEYNQSTLPVGTIPSHGTARVVYAINDSPAQNQPATEDEVLRDNGCKIKFLDKKLVINNRPVPDAKDSSGIQMTLGRKFINFNTTNPDVAHYGVVGFISQPLTTLADPSNKQNIYVYCKLTFQLADPR